MPDGVAEVEDHAEAGLFFIFADNVGFDADGCGYDFRQGGGVGVLFCVEDGFSVLFHVAEEVCVVDDAGFDRLLQAGAQLSRWKGAKEIGVGEDGLRVIKAADEIFSGCEVDAGFSADGGVDLREESGGDLHVADAAHVDGGEEACDVADDAATEGEEERVAVGSCGGELLGEGFDTGHAFVRFATGEKEDGGRFFEAG